MFQVSSWLRRPRGPSRTVRRIARSRSILVLILSGILLTVAVLAATGLVLLNLRDRAIAETEHQLQTSAAILAEQADRAFQALELVQLGLIERMETHAIVSNDLYERAMGGHDIHLLLKDKINGLPHVDAAMLIGAGGRLINSSKAWPVLALDVSGHDYFVELNSNPRISSFIGQPIRDRATGAWTIPIARKFLGTNGELLGLVVGVIRPQYFEQLYQSVAPEPDKSIALFRRDGVLLARHPHVDAMIGQSFAARQLFNSTLSHADRGVARDVGIVDGRERLIAAATLTH